jgi:hypothetical protein
VKWDHLIAAAKALDAMAVREFGQSDPDHHLCCAQREQRARGYVMVEIATNMFGYVVRDTMNDGQGRLFGGRMRPGTTKAEAVAWASNWHAEDPDNREVIMGYCPDDQVLT